jgi:hypothetical protein
VLAAWCGATRVWPQLFWRPPGGPPAPPASTRIVVRADDLSLATAVDRHIRTFKLNPNVFIVAANETTRSGNAVEPKDIQERVRDFFSAAGIDLASDNAPRLFFNDRTGTLTVHGTLAQLEAIEKGGANPRGQLGPGRDRSEADGNTGGVSKSRITGTVNKIGAG